MTGVEVVQGVVTGGGGGGRMGLEDGWGGCGGVL